MIIFPAGMPTLLGHFTITWILVSFESFWVVFGIMEKSRNSRL